jgi:FeS assembly SUF system protein
MAEEKNDIARQQPDAGAAPRETANEQSPTAAQPLSSIEKTIIEAQVIEALRLCFDPEIPVNIYELGLIYKVAVADDGGVGVQMTLTTPHCPAAQSLPSEVEARVKKVQGVTGAKVFVVWDPPWSPQMMTEAARLELGFM